VSAIEYGIERLSLLLMRLPDTLWRSFIIDGIVGGVGGVVSFLPNVLILFFFITIFEETGYIHRVMLVTDRFMHAVGLHGDSFLPLVMGFGCNVPAIVAAKRLQDKRQRWLTILVIPFMSCNARLPVFVLITGAFFPQHAPLILFLLYLIGIAVAAASSLLFSAVFFKYKNRYPHHHHHDNNQYYHHRNHAYSRADMRQLLTPYRIPHGGQVARKVWAEASDYLHKITNVVIVAAAVIWALNTFPLNRENNPEHASYLQQVGRAISPVFAPLGFDWKLSMALFTGVAAKETIVSTLGVLYPADDALSLGVRLRSEAAFGAPTAAAFLIFILLYFPCISVVVSIWKETRSAWFTMLSVCYTCAVAWLAAWLTQAAGKLLC
jgi:ferrous iron transport protein B